MEAFLLSAGVIFLAELGDKSQLMAMAFAARYRFWPVMIGITGGTLLVHAGSVFIGRVAATALRRVGLDPAAVSGPTSLRDGDRRALYLAEIARADAEYKIGVAGIRHLLNGGRSIRVAANLYREILRQIERDGFGVRRPHRPVVGRARKAVALVRAVTSS